MCDRKKSYATLCSNNGTNSWYHDKMCELFQGHRISEGFGLIMWPSVMFPLNRTVQPHYVILLKNISVLPPRHQIKCFSSPKNLEKFGKMLRKSFATKQLGQTKPNTRYLQNTVSERSIVSKNSKKCLKIHKNHVITWGWNLQSQPKPTM